MLIKLGNCVKYDAEVNVKHKKSVMQDPAVYEQIVRLREKDKKSFEEIAKILEKQGVKTRLGTPPTSNTAQWMYYKGPKASQAYAGQTAELTGTINQIRKILASSAKDSVKLEMIQIALGD